MNTVELTTVEQKSIFVPASLPADENPVLVYLAGLGKGSRRTMRHALDTIARVVSNGKLEALDLDWPSMRFKHTAAIRSALAENYAPATANKMLSALRGVLKSAWRLGQMDAETYHRAIDIKRVDGETLPAGRSITAGELRALMLACGNDQSAAGVRDGAIVALLYSCGLRRGELVNLNVADYDTESGDLAIKRRGKSGLKRGKERLLPVVNGAAGAMTDWLNIRGDEPGPVFWRIHRSGLVTKNRLTTQAIYNILRKRASEAGVKDLSPHDFRRTFVGDLLDAGADIAIVQKLAGHADPATTARYDRRPEAAKRKAAKLLHVPYERRTL